MLDYGKVTETIYKRSVKKVIEKYVSGAGENDLAIRNVMHFSASRDKGIVTASATLSGKMLAAAAAHSEVNPSAAADETNRLKGADMVNHLAAAGAVHLAVNRLAAAGGRAQAATIQMLVPTELSEKSIKALTGAAAESCAKLQIASVQADVMAAGGLAEPVISVTAIGEAESLFKSEKAEADQDIIMAGYAGNYGAAKLTFANQEELEKHFNPVFLSPILDADDTGAVFSAVPAVEKAAAAGVTSMYACGEGGVYAAVWEMAENAGLGARIQLKEVPLKQETVEICDYFNISPYQLISVGAVLLTATHGQKVLAELAAAGIPAVIIGHLTDDNDRVVLNEEEVRFLEPFRYESLNHANQAQS